MSVTLEGLHKSSIDYLTAWTTETWIESFNYAVQDVLDVTDEGIGTYAATSRRCTIVINEDPNVDPKRRLIKIHLTQSHANGKMLLQLIAFPCHRPHEDSIMIVSRNNQNCIRECTTEQMMKSWFALYRSTDPY